MNTDSFTDGYIECALWSSNDESTSEGGEPLDANYSREDFAEETLRLFAAECAEFQRQNESDLAEFAEVTGRPDDHAGHDFWLTRNGHGAGFWDRGAGDVGDRLTDACKAWGEIHLYVGDDGKLYA